MPRNEKGTLGKMSMFPQIDGISSRDVSKRGTDIEVIVFSRDSTLIFFSFRLKMS